MVTCQVIICQVGDFEPCMRQSLVELISTGSAAAHAHTDENMGLSRGGESIVELGQLGLTQRATEVQETARPLRDGGRKQDLSPGADLGALDHVGHALE